MSTFLDTLIPSAARELLGASRDVPRFSLTVQSDLGPMAGPARLSRDAQGGFVLSCMFMAHARKPGVGFNTDTSCANSSPRAAVVGLVRHLGEMHRAKAVEKDRAAARCAYKSTREDREEIAAEHRAAAERLDLLAAALESAWPESAP